ncbi:MAG: hypothetical protein AB1346_04940 [Thermodesulfobacteriota bacterium]
MKKYILLSLALHLFALAWASPARQTTAASIRPAATWAAVLVDLPVPAPPRAAPTPAPEAIIGEKRAEAVQTVARKEEPPVSASQVVDQEAAAAPSAYVPIRIVGNDDFARMARMREAMAKTSSYCRSAPKGFEGVLRSALPSAALAEGGSAIVDIGILPSGEAGGIEIASESPALLAALRGVPWESAPLPARYRIQCSRVRVSVTIAGERMKVGVLVL